MSRCRSRLTLTVSALALLAALGTSSLPAAARPTSAPGWRIVTELAPAGQSASVNEVVPTGSKDAWAGGDICPPCVEGSGFELGNMLLEHWDGSAWGRVRPPAALLRNLHGPATIDASSPRNVWIFVAGSGSYTVLRYNGVRWTRFVLPGSAEPHHNYGSGGGTAVFGPDDAWIFVGDFAFHYAHHTMHSSRLPAALRGGPGIVAPLSADDIWLLGRYARATGKPGNRWAAMHWNGKSWSVVSLGAVKIPALRTVHLGPIVASGPRDVWVLANVVHAPFLLHWTGPASGWSQVSLPASTVAVYGMTQDGGGGLWLYVYREDQTWQLDHYDAGSWTQEGVPTEPGGFTTIYSMAWIPGTHSVWAAGTSSSSAPTAKMQGVILKYGS